MKFLDLQTGYSFDALWTNGQTNGYVFWFPNEQSVDITYTMPICMLCDEKEPIEVSMEENDVFSFISSTESTDIDDVTFGVPCYTHSQFTEVEQLKENLYVHKVYVSAMSTQEGEFRVFVKIGNYGYIKLGADFYGENENLHINLSNYGMDIPNTIQKAIYDSNVHEDFKDSILINRKLKELLSNYWDIIANRGSYKSLINSLNWFEWGDIVKIREMWKRETCGKQVYDEREIMSLLEDKYIDSFGNFQKTTYLALTAATKEDTNMYDIEGNPILTDISFKWSIEDLKIKHSLLTEFFGKYFLPIHLSIYHHCVEDIIYTNTIKSITNGVMTNQNVFGNFDFVECNIKDDSTFKITNVRTQVTEDTMFGVTSDMDTTHTHFGVDTFPSKGMVTEKSLPTFSRQYYTGPGVIIPFEFTIKTNEPREFLKYMSVSFVPDGKDERDLIVFNKNVFQRGGKIRVKFNFLSKLARDYDMVFTFILSSSKTLTRRVKFEVVDIDNPTLSVYRIVAKDDSGGFTYEDFHNTDMNDTYFKIQKRPNGDPFKQYFPHSINQDHSGIKLNRVIALDVSNNTDNSLIYVLARLKMILCNYLIFYKYDENNRIKNVIAVSKRFYEDTPNFKRIESKYTLIKNHLGYFPQFHKLERIAGDSIEDYTISQYDAICVIPEIHKYGNTYEQFRYGHMINDIEWSFINTSNDVIYNIPESARLPHLSSNDEQIVDDGFYDVVFKYKLGGKQNEMRLNGAFRKKTI